MQNITIADLEFADKQANKQLDALTERLNALRKLFEATGLGTLKVNTKEAINSLKLATAELDRFQQAGQKAVVTLGKDLEKGAKKAPQAVQAELRKMNADTVAKLSSLYQAGAREASSQLITMMGNLDKTLRTKLNTIAKGLGPASSVKEQQDARKKIEDILRRSIEAELNAATKTGSDKLRILQKFAAEEIAINHQVTKQTSKGNQEKIESFLDFTRKTQTELSGFMARSNRIWKSSGSGTTVDQLDMEFQATWEQIAKLEDLAREQAANAGKSQEELTQITMTGQAKRIALERQYVRSKARIQAEETTDLDSHLGRIMGLEESERREAFEKLFTLVKAQKTEFLVEAKVRHLEESKLARQAGQDLVAIERRQNQELLELANAFGAQMFRVKREAHRAEETKRGGLFGEGLNLHQFALIDALKNIVTRFQAAKGAAEEAGDASLNFGQKAKMAATIAASAALGALLVSLRGAVQFFKDAFKAGEQLAEGMRKVGMASQQMGLTSKQSLESNLIRGSVIARREISALADDMVKFQKAVPTANLEATTGAVIEIAKASKAWGIENEALIRQFGLMQATFGGNIDDQDEVNKRISNLVYVSRTARIEMGDLNQEYTKLADVQKLLVDTNVEQENSLNGMIATFGRLTGDGEKAITMTEGLQQALLNANVVEAFTKANESLRASGKAVVEGFDETNGVITNMEKFIATMNNARDATVKLKDGVFTFDEAVGNSFSFEGEGVQQLVALQTMMGQGAETYVQVQKEMRDAATATERQLFVQQESVSGKIEESKTRIGAAMTEIGSFFYKTSGPIAEMKTALLDLFTPSEAAFDIAIDKFERLQIVIAGVKDSISTAGAEISQNLEAFSGMGDDYTFRVDLTQFQGLYERLPEIETFSTTAADSLRKLFEQGGKTTVDNLSALQAQLENVNELMSARQIVDFLDTMRANADATADTLTDSMGRAGDAVRTLGKGITDVDLFGDDAFAKTKELGDDVEDLADKLRDLSTNDYGVNLGIAGAGDPAVAKQTLEEMADVTKQLLALQIERGDTEEAIAKTKITLAQIDNEILTTNTILNERAMETLDLARLKAGADWENLSVQEQIELVTQAINGIEWDSVQLRDQILGLVTETLGVTGDLTVQTGLLTDAEKAVLEQVGLCLEKESEINAEALKRLGYMESEQQYLLTELGIRRALLVAQGQSTDAVDKEIVVTQQRIATIQALLARGSKIVAERNAAAAKEESDQGSRINRIAGARAKQRQADEGKADKERKKAKSDADKEREKAEKEHQDRLKKIQDTYLDISKQTADVLNSIRLGAMSEEERPFEEERLRYQSHLAELRKEFGENALLLQAANKLHQANMAKVQADANKKLAEEAAKLEEQRREDRKEAELELSEFLKDQADVRRRGNFISIELEIDDLKQTYDEMLKLARKHGLDEVRIAREYRLQIRRVQTEHIREIRAGIDELILTFQGRSELALQFLELDRAGRSIGGTVERLRSQLIDTRGALEAAVQLRHQLESGDTSVSKAESELEGVELRARGIMELMADHARTISTQYVQGGISISQAFASVTEAMNQMAKRSGTPMRLFADPTAIQGATGELQAQIASLKTITTLTDKRLEIERKISGLQSGAESGATEGKREEAKAALAEAQAELAATNVQLDAAQKAGATATQAAVYNDQARGMAELISHLAGQGGRFRGDEYLIDLMNRYKAVLPMIDQAHAKWSELDRMERQGTDVIAEHRAQLRTLMESMPGAISTSAMTMLDDFVKRMRAYVSVTDELLKRTREMESKYSGEDSSVGQFRSDLEEILQLDRDIKQVDLDASIGFQQYGSLTDDIREWTQLTQSSIEDLFDNIGARLRDYRKEFDLSVQRLEIGDFYDEEIDAANKVGVALSDAGNTATDAFGKLNEQLAITEADLRRILEVATQAFAAGSNQGGLGPAINSAKLATRDLRDTEFYDTEAGQSRIPATGFQLVLDAFFAVMTQRAAAMIDSTKLDELMQLADLAAKTAKVTGATANEQSQAGVSAIQQRGRQVGLSDQEISVAQQQFSLMMRFQLDEVAKSVADIMAEALLQSGIAEKLGATIAETAATHQVGSDVGQYWGKHAAETAAEGLNKEMPTLAESFSSNSAYTFMKELEGRWKERVARGETDLSLREFALTPEGIREIMTELLAAPRRQAMANTEELRETSPRIIGTARTELMARTLREVEDAIDSVTESFQDATSFLETRLESEEKMIAVQKTYTESFKGLDQQIKNADGRIRDITRAMARLSEKSIQDIELLVKEGNDILTPLRAELASLQGEYASAVAGGDSQRAFGLDQQIRNLKGEIKGIEEAYADRIQAEKDYMAYNQQRTDQMIAQNEKVKENVSDAKTDLAVRQGQADIQLAREKELEQLQGIASKIQMATDWMGKFQAALIKVTSINYEKIGKDFEGGDVRAGMAGVGDVFGGIGAVASNFGPYGEIVGAAFGFAEGLADFIGALFGGQTDLTKLERAAAEHEKINGLLAARNDLLKRATDFGNQYLDSIEEQARFMAASLRELETGPFSLAGQSNTQGTLRLTGLKSEAAILKETIAELTKYQDNKGILDEGRQGELDSATERLAMIDIETQSLEAQLDLRKQIRDAVLQQLDYQRSLNDNLVNAGEMTSLAAAQSAYSASLDILNKALSGTLRDASGQLVSLSESELAKLQADVESAREAVNEAERKGYQHELAGIARDEEVDGLDLAEKRMDVLQRQLRAEQQILAQLIKEGKSTDEIREQKERIWQLEIAINKEQDKRSSKVDKEMQSILRYRREMARAFTSDGVITGEESARYNEITARIRSELKERGYPEDEIEDMIKAMGFQLPRYHKGGVVKGRRGSEVLTLLQPGEVVTPENETRAYGGPEAFRAMVTGNASKMIQSATNTVIHGGPATINNTFGSAPPSPEAYARAMKPIIIQIARDVITTHERERGRARG